MQERERERARDITSFPAISGLIRYVEDPFQALINESHYAYHVILQKTIVCMGEGTCRQVGASHAYAAEERPRSG